MSLNMSIPELDNILDSIVEDDVSEQDNTGVIDIDNLGLDNLKSSGQIDVVIQSEESVNNLDMQGKNVQEILGLTKKQNRFKKSILSLSHHPFDLDTFKYILEHSSVLQEIHKKGENVLKSFSHLMNDMFLSLYKYKPEIVSIQDMSNATKINNMIIRKIIDTQEWRQLRYSCRLDEYKSSIGVELISRKALEIIIELKDMYEQMIKDNTIQNNPIDELNKLYDAEVNARQLSKKEIEEALNHGLDDDINHGVNDASNYDSTTVNQDTGYTAEQAMQIADALADQLVSEDALERMYDVLEPSFTDLEVTMNKASTQIEEVSKFIDQWGFNSNDNSIRISLEDKRRAIEKIRRSKKLKELSELLGKLKEVAKFEQKKKSKNGAAAIKTVEIGNKIENVLPSERMLLGNETTKKVFLRKYNQKELLQYKRDSMKRKAKGPMIVCVDTSGSMNNSKEKWSKAVAITLLEIAQTQKRNFGCILYSDVIDKVYMIEKGNLDPLTVVEIAERFDGGGTNFEEPLNESLKMIKDSRFKNADIVFITDGDCGISERFLKNFNKTKQDKEFVVTSIVIDTGHSSDTTLKTFSDDIIKMSKMAELTDADSEIAHKLFSSI